MFATLLGGLPRPTGLTTSTDGAIDVAAAVAAAVQAQELAGLEPITNGRLRDPDFKRLTQLLADDPVVAVAEVVAGWTATAALTDRAVKQALPGPYAAARRLAGSSSERQAWTAAIADALHDVVVALADAGCPLVEIEEGEPQLLGKDVAEHGVFQKAHERLTRGIEGTHLSLSIAGGSVPDAAIGAVLAPPYASVAVDLIAGPDNWRLVTKLAGDRGAVVGALSAAAPPEAKEVLLWAAHYAASSGGRGIARVGLGSAGSWANLTWEVALDRLQRLGEAARLAALPPGDELASSIDPRAIDARTAAVGRRSATGR